MFTFSGWFFMFVFWRDWIWESMGWPSKTKLPVDLFNAYIPTEIKYKKYQRQYTAHWYTLDSCLMPPLDHVGPSVEHISAGLWPWMSWGYFVSTLYWAPLHYWYAIWLPAINKSLRNWKLFSRGSTVLELFAPDKMNEHRWLMINGTERQTAPTERKVYLTNLVSHSSKGLKAILSRLCFT